MENYDRIETDDEGTKHYYLGDKLHRTDGPAVEYVKGTKYWYIKGKCHREGLPAIIYWEGTKAWYYEGLCHREDGPALDYSGTNGHQSYWWRGEMIACANLEEFRRLVRLRAFW